MTDLSIKTSSAHSQILEKDVFDSLSDLPKYGRVLSGSSASALLQMPASACSGVCVIETAVKRALILYDVPRYRELRPFLGRIQLDLLTLGYKLERNAKGCTADVIQYLNENAEQSGAMDDAFPADEAISQSRARQIFESWIDYAVQENATDIHIQIASSIAEVKVRVDGSLELIRDRNGGVYTPVQAEKAVAWAYNNASGRGSNSNSQFNDTDNLYCMISPREVGEKKVALRYQSVKGWTGVKVVCRLLYSDIDIKTLSYEQLGYAPSHIQLLNNAANTPSGLILFSGVTGSGKTTTLKTFVETHPDNGTDAFYSIEDPVEYPLRGVHQIPIQRDLIDREGSAKKYSEVIAALMRADPGCVLMGEIRDVATAISAQQIVETGHMACGTVHAHLISGIIPRLTNQEIGMSRDVLTNPNILTLLAYQALVPKLCSNCARTIEQLDPNDEAEMRLKRALDQMEYERGINLSHLRFKNKLGCSECRGRGTRGLTVVAEILSPDSHWLKLIRSGQDYEAVQYFRSFSDRNYYSENMRGKTVFEHCLFKALSGSVDIRNCERFESFERYLAEERVR